MPKDNQKPLVIKSKSFVSDVKELRRRARQHLQTLLERFGQEHDERSAR
mgnify:CR=1 FL=1